MQHIDRILLLNYIRNKFTYEGRVMDTREIVFNLQNESSKLFLYKRSRLNKLFKEAVRFPLTLVCAGAGYGKTTAVHDFIEDQKEPAVWMQITERDNVAERFWENYAHALRQFNVPFSSAISKIGFPDSEDRQKQYMAVAEKYLSPLDRRIIVVDDVHNLENPIIIRLAEQIIHNLANGTTKILISRSTPKLNIMGMISKGQVFNVSENDLRFTDNELSHYFRQLDISPQPESLREIMKDTEGWAFAINLIARSYQKAPGYGGYLRSAMKTNVFQVMETEIWNSISEKVQRFMVRLSLIGHLSYELIELLAGGDKRLIDEMEQQNAYIRRDSFINAYLIHPLFLEFLASKQNILSDKQKRETYTIAGEWCNKNGFNIDALSYYEKTEDYKAIVSLLNILPAQLPYDIAKYAMVIFERAPAEAFDTVEYLSVSHVRCFIRLGLWQRAIELAEYYERKFLKLPKNDVFRNRNLGILYLIWGYLRNFMCVSDDSYDFDQYFEKFCKYYDKPDSMKMFPIRIRVLGPWVNAAGSSRKGAPDDYIKTVSRAAAIISKRFSGFMAGEDDIAWGELKFFQGEMASAEAFLAQGLRKAQDNRQFEIQHRALLYILRISIAQGNYSKAEQALKEMKDQQDDSDYHNRFRNYEISLAWYYFIIGFPEKIPDWIKQDFAPFSHPSSIENLENHMKARYFYITRNYPPLLTYFQEMKKKESYLYGRITMLAIEACVHYKKKDKGKAFVTLLEAYKTASPNDIIMPFIELGKDMRTLTAAVLKESGKSIPKSWLENINRKAASYAKQQAHIITKYRQVNRLDTDVFITPRESEILRDLSHGFSRAEIASNLGLSINTVKMVINNIYSKLGAENLANLIRIATERKLI